MLPVGYDKRVGLRTALPDDGKHRAALFLRGQSPATWKPGRLHVTVSSCSVTNSSSDGIYVHHGVTAVLRDLTFENIVRGAITITGNGADVTAERIFGKGAIAPPGIDIEPNDLAHAVTVRLDEVQLAGKLDVGLTPRSTFEGRDVRAGGVFHLNNQGRSFLLIDSLLDGKGPLDLRYAGRATFRNCRMRGAAIRFSLPGREVDSSLLVMENCRYIDLPAQTGGKP